jgi:hypothetical protein
MSRPLYGADSGDLWDWGQTVTNRQAAPLEHPDEIGQDSPVLFDTQPDSGTAQFGPSASPDPEDSKMSNIKLPMQPVVAVPSLRSLSFRRREIRRRRRPAIRGLALNAAWGVVFLLCGWLLFSGIFGLPGA